MIPAEWMSRRALALLAGVALLAGAACSGDPTDPSLEDDGIATVGPEGGEVRLGSSAGVEIPAGALSTSTTITVTEAPTPSALRAEGAVGQAYRFRPAGLQFDVPVEVFVHVGESALGGVPVEQVILISTGASGGGVEQLPVVERSSASGGFVIRATTDHFSVISPAVPPKEPPTADAGPDREANVGETVELSGSGSDPDGGEVRYQWTVASRPEGGEAELEDADTDSPTLTPDSSGTWEIRLEVTDDEDDTATDSMVLEVNAPPTADAGSDQSGELGDTFTLDGTGSHDPDGDSLSYEWTVVDEPEGSQAEPSDPTSAQTDFRPDVAGAYAIELEVDDGRGGSDTDTTTITAEEDEDAPPTGSLEGPDEVLVGTTVTIDGSWRDPEGESLTVEVELVAPRGSLPDLTRDGTKFTFLADVAGAYTLKVRVSDGENVTVLEKKVEAYPDVAGTYRTEFVVTSADGINCGGLETGDSRVRDMTVTQPSPDRVVPNLRALMPQLQQNPVMTLGTDGEALFDGSLPVEGGLTATGTMTIQFTADGLTGSFDFDISGFCQIRADLTSPPP